MRRNGCKIVLAQSTGLNLAKESSVFLYMPKNSLTALAQDQKRIFSLYKLLGGSHVLSMSVFILSLQPLSVTCLSSIPPYST